MALTSKEKEKLDQLDFTTGGGFSDFLTDKKKLEPTGSKILFVGLGGKGCNTVAAIKTEVYKRIQCSEDKQRPGNFEYLAIDTDSNTLSQVAKGGGGQIGLSNAPEDMETCQLYDDTAAGKLKAPEKLPENIKTWINPLMNQELTGSGAGGIRQAGRYLLFGGTAFPKVEGQLRIKLGNLHKQIINPAKEKLIVYIFAGISGGTGSGTIIDIPYIIRQICKNNGWSVKVCSYLFLPDTYPAYGEHLKYNAYAALKEIDTLMNLGQMGGAASFQATYQPGFTVNAQEKIFDSCVLISGKQAGRGAVADPDAYTRKVVVDNIVNMVSDSTITDGTTGNSTFLVNSFLDNSPTEIQSKVVLQPNAVPRNAFYQYMVIGVGALILPLEQILAYIAHGTMDKMVQGWDKHATQSNVEDVLACLHATPEEIRQRINTMSTVPVMEYYKGIGGVAKKQQIRDDSLRNSIKNMWMSKNNPLCDAWDIARNKCQEEIISTLDKKYKSSFQNADKGIYFLKELISFRVVDGNGFNGLKERMQKEYLDAIQGLINGQEYVKQQAESRMKEIQQELDSPILGVLKEGKLIEEYRSCCVQGLVADNWIEMYRNYAYKCLKEIIAWLDKRLEELQKYIDVFTYMKEIVDKNYDSVMNSTLPTAEYAAAIMDFSKAKEDDDVKKVLTYLDNLMVAKTPEGLVTALEDKLQTTEKLWLHSTEEFSPLKVFVQFIEAQYPNLSNMTLEYFLNLKYGAAGFNTGMLALCSELESKAAVTFPASTTLNLNTLASHRYVLVPSQAANIMAQVVGFTKGQNVAVANGEDQNSIYWYNLIIGVPLFDLLDIDTYEMSYEMCTKEGLHIQETAENNWKDLPALSNQKIWDTPDFNSREREFAEQVEKDVKTYLDCGLIANTRLSYVAYCLPENNVKHTPETVLDWCRTTYLTNPIRTDVGEIDTGKDFVSQLCTANEFHTYQVQIPSVYMATINDGNVHELVRMDIFLYRKLQKTYAVYQDCIRLIAEVNDKQQKEKQQKRDLQRFYEYIRTGIIGSNEMSILLTESSGNEIEVLFLGNLGEVEKGQKWCYAFEAFSKEFTEEQKQYWDSYCKELTEKRDMEILKTYQKLSDDFINEVNACDKNLKKLETKKKFIDLDMGELLDKFAGYYAYWDLIKK